MIKPYMDRRTFISLISITLLSLCHVANKAKAQGVEEKVKNIIVEQLGASKDEVLPASRLAEDLGADSLDIVELIMAFEEEFDIEIPDEDAEKLKTVQLVVHYIKNKTDGDNQSSQKIAESIRKKEQINLVMLGQINHGKTMLLSAITKVLSKRGMANYMSFDQLSQAPEKKWRGATIAVSHVEFETQKRHYTASDFPRHADIVKGLITGDVAPDGAVLVVSAADGPLPQTREHVRLARLLNVPAMVVFLHIEDRVDDRRLDSVELEIRKLLHPYGFLGDDIPIIRGSAWQALHNDGTGPDAERIIEFLSVVDAHIPTPIRAVERPFLMLVEDVFTISGRGTVATGRVERGMIQVGDEVEIVGLRPTRQTVVTGVEMFRKIVDRGEVGDNIGVLLKGVQRDELERGQVLAKPGSITPHTRFVAEVYMLTQPEGGRYTSFINDYRPQFYFRTTDVTGTVTLPAGTAKVLPGDNVAVEVELIAPMALEKGLRFALREGGRTVGTGVVSELLPPKNQPSPTGLAGRIRERVRRWWRALKEAVAD